MDSEGEEISRNVKIAAKMDKKGGFQDFIFGMERHANYLFVSSGEKRPQNPLSVVREEHANLRKAGVGKGAWLALCGLMLTNSGFGMGGVIFVRKNTLSSSVFGPHIGATDQPQGNLGMHTDESKPLGEMIANLTGYIEGKKRMVYQRATHYLASLPSGTVTLHEKDLATNEFRPLSLRKYRRWLRWVKDLVELKPQQKEHQDFVNNLENRGKVDWPKDLVSPERFEEFSEQCGGKYIIVSSTPPPTMAPGFRHGFAHKLEQE